MTNPIHYWLMKSEPDVYSIDDLAKAPQQKGIWEGVRNYQVRNMMQEQMQVGDQAFFYHSSCAEPGIVGIMEIVREAYPDDTAFDAQSKYYDSKSSSTNPRWYRVDVRLVRKFKRLISLRELRQNPQLKQMILLRRGNRLSITPVTENEWKIILKNE